MPCTWCALLRQLNGPSLQRNAEQICGTDRSPRSPAGPASNAATCENQVSSYSQRTPGNKDTRQAKSARIPEFVDGCRPLRHPVPPGQHRWSQPINHYLDKREHRPTCAYHALGTPKTLARLDARLRCKGGSLPLPKTHTTHKTRTHTDSSALTRRQPNARPHGRSPTALGSAHYRNPGLGIISSLLYLEPPLLSPSTSVSSLLESLCLRHPPGTSSGSGAT